MTKLRRSRCVTSSGHYLEDGILIIRKSISLNCEIAIIRPSPAEIKMKITVTIISVTNKGMASYRAFSAVLVDASGVSKHQLETVGEVRCVGLEGVARSFEQVDVVASLVVDEMEVIHFRGISIDFKCIGTVSGSLEVNGQLSFIVAAHHSVVVVGLWDIDFRVVGVQHELGQLAALSEADDGAVDDVVTVLDNVDDEFFAIAGACPRCEGYGFAIAFGDDEDALHGGNLVSCGSHNLFAIVFHDIKGAADGGGGTKRVADEVPAREVSVVIFDEGDIAAAGIGFGAKVKGDIRVVGIKVALTSLKVEVVGFVVLPFGSVAGLVEMKGRD